MLGAILAAGFGLGALMGNPRRKKRRRNPTKRLTGVAHTEANKTGHAYVRSWNGLILRNTAKNRKLIESRYGGIRDIVRPSKRRRNPSAEARELALFIVNDGDLYRQQAQPIIKNLRKKIAKGTYDGTKALKLWGYLANSGAQKYTKEFGGSGNGSYGSFSPAHRRDAAHELAAAYEDELRETNPRRRRSKKRRR